MSNTIRFLRRIGLTDIKVEHTLEFLGRVQNACVLTIPYENLDILESIPISLDKDDIFDKIVTRHRGGYCFELNALLHNALVGMGFKVRSCFARYLRGETAIPFRRHRIVIVELDGEEYLLDIGVGQTAPRLPLKLEAGLIQTQGNEVYFFEKNDELGWVLCDIYKGCRRKYISFTNEAQFEVDFQPTSFWCEKHPDSPFNKAPMLAIKTEKGRMTVDGNDFKVFEGERLVSIKEGLSKDELRKIYSEYFGICL